ncbi:DUF4124 domain-containing protein [Curvibacter sp. CHRR-16]|uniref:DUF4124 domain-containing protein n=1 Tax=Curvibacter sp. CHRR-16 TaxID=2835872 RepID=UPI001BDB3AFC|nr:DUF4124 domain-containing protein [Curvibacter sp. CHRR-16]MBT0570064.1 DUF4124 domain-containing protein [Curvibacter sp. CHRR-16]
MRSVCSLLLGMLLCGGPIALAHAADAAGTNGIFVCVDSKGRRLTSDRPIADCLDREQRVLNPSGSTRERRGPVLTAKEQAEYEARQRADQEAAERQADERRRDRALATRYPNKAAHEKQRQDSLSAINGVIDAVQRRIDELVGQRAQLDAEAKAYGTDTSKWPSGLRARREANAQNLSSQQRFLSDQEQERQRINARFDEELRRLEGMWAQQAQLQ